MAASNKRKAAVVPVVDGKDGLAAGGKKSTLENNLLAAAKNNEQARQDIRLSFLIHDVSRMRRAAFDQFMKPLGITRAQWWVLAHLSRSDGMQQVQIADLLEVGKASIGDVIGSLEAGGWVVRLSDPSDKRAKRVFLTNASQSVIKQMTVMETKFNDRILADLSTPDRTKLYKMLMTIKNSISLMASEQAGDAADE